MLKLIPMKKCIACSKANEHLFCPTCIKDPFKFEKGRQILASRKRLGELGKLYGRGVAEIKNLNTSDFWDERIDESIDHLPPDGMTKERVEIAYSFIPKNSKRVLDIGAGYGYVEKLLSKNKNVEIYGNDISENAIKNLKRRFKGNFKIESVYSMKYKPGFFDAALMLEVLEHIPPSKTFKVLADIKKLLKKGGYLIVSVPTNEGLEDMKDNPNGHVRMYTVDLIKAELKIAGFKAENVKTLYAFNTMYLFKKFLAKVFRNKWFPNDIIVLAKSV